MFREYMYTEFDKVSRELGLHNVAIPRNSHDFIANMTLCVYLYPAYIHRDINIKWSKPRVHVYIQLIVTGLRGMKKPSAKCTFVLMAVCEMCSWVRVSRTLDSCVTISLNPPGVDR